MENPLKQKLYIYLVIVLVAVAIGAAAYSGLQAFLNYKIQKEENLILQRQEEKEEAAKIEQENLEKELREKLRDEEIADLKRKIEELESKPESVQTVNNTVTVEAKDKVAEIVKEWSPRVAHMECSWFNTSDTLIARAAGSVTIVNFTNLGLRAITSKHILVDKNKVAPRECKITLTEGTSYSIPISESNLTVGIEDWAYVSLPTDDILLNVAKQSIKLCGVVDIGDKLLILGYPRIGAKTGLTVTEGIVSGVDANYYITSAKIDKGNSGGAAVLVKDDCYLGIPSASVVGTIESLGRILKASFVIN